ncbi:hypothetical protein [Streptomyces sp. GESEQ-35]|uniref:hypothetical protein n=1 Tax=Streptomyces sp. GESEQ-35 TaxID=2812657 RepID=UPI001B325C44|nr:hypothetical protein [Streptomyces sp. GESEQ-35]
MTSGLQGREPGRRRGRPLKELDPDLGPAVRGWATYARGVVGELWPSRQDAARALATEKSELSRILAGKLMPAKEWLTALHEARERVAGVPVPAGDRARAFGLYMDALKESEDEAALRPAGKKPYQQRWARYDLEWRLEEAGTQLADALTEREELDSAVADLNRALRTARDTATAREAGVLELRRQNEWQQRQLTAASAFVRDLELQLQNSEEQREYMAATILRLEAEVRTLRRQVNFLTEEEERRQRVAEPAMAMAGANRAEGNASGVRDVPRRDGGVLVGESRSLGGTATHWRRPDPPYFTALRLVGFVLAAGALMVGAYLSWGPFQDLRAYQRAQSCGAAEAARTADCVGQETGEVAQKDSYEEGDKESKQTIYELTVRRASGSFEMHQVHSEVYSAAQVGIEADLKIWHGRVVEIAVGAETFELTPMGADLAWRLGLLWAGLGLLLWSLLGNGGLGYFAWDLFPKVFGWAFAAVGLWKLGTEVMGRGPVALAPSLGYGVIVAFGAGFVLFGPDDWTDGPEPAWRVWLDRLSLWRRRRMSVPRGPW